MAVGDGFGLGVVLEAKDLFHGTFQRFGADVADVEGKTSAASVKVSNSLKMMGTGMAILGVGVGGLAALGPALGAFSDFEHQLGQIRTVIDETALSTAAAAAATRGLADTYGSGPIAQANALYETISAGVTDATKAVELLTIANQFAIGGDADLAAGVDVLTSSVNTYATEGLKASEASDALFVAIAAGKTNARELSQSLGEVAPTAKALGVGFDELTASIAALTVQGIKTPQAVTGINAVLSNIAKPTTDASKEAKRLGIEFDATALKTLGLKGVLAQLTTSTKLNDSSFVNLFGSIDGVKAALALTAGGGSKLNEIIEQMKGKAGATEKAFKIMEQTMGFQTKRFDSLKESAMTLVGEALEPAARGALRFGNAVLSAFTSLPDGVRTFLVQGFALASTLLVIVGGALALKAGIGVLAAGLSAAGVTAASFGAMLAPIVLVLAAIGLAVVGFRAAWDANVGGIATKITHGVEQVKLVFGAFGQLLEDGGISGAIRDDLNKAENGGLKNFVKTVWLFANRVQAAWEGVSGGFKAVMETAGPAIDAFGNSLGKLFAPLAGLGASIDPSGARSKFEQWQVTGQKVGEALGRVVVSGIELATWAIDMGVKAKKLIDDLGGVERILDVLKIALVVLVASKAAGALSGIGGAGIEAALGIGKAAAASNLFSAGGMIRGAPSAIAALKNISSAAGAALGPIGAMTAAITALYLAYDQWTKLSKELGESGWSDMATKLKNDLGITSDSTYQTQMGLVTGDEYDRQVKSGEIKNGLNTAPSIVPPAASFSTKQESGPANVQDAAAMYAPIVDAISASNAKQGPAPAPKVALVVKLDSKEIRSTLESADRSDGDANGAPGMSVMD